MELEKIKKSDNFAINYTSGTTGAPKGVVHTHSLMYCFDKLNRYYWWNIIRGEIVKVFVVLKKGYEPSDELVKDIQQYVKKMTAPYKYPRAIEFVKDLPKTISGKIKRRELRIMEFERKKDVIEKLKEKGLWQR